MGTSYIQSLQAGLDVKAALEALRTENLAGGGATKSTVIADLTAIRNGVIAALTAVDTLATAVNTLATKLNADAGVTDTNYATSNATNNAATSTPAAITTA